MKQAIIDIGSNSMRLTLYEVEGKTFRILFREKNMAALASYVEKGALTKEGIACACTGLRGFRETLDLLGIAHTAVFATASLRNISNTDEALRRIRAAVGWDVEVISGKEEALLSYRGAMRELAMDSGAFIDIGGASTEVVTFEAGKAVDWASFPVGSLSLYRSCVKKILPGDGSLKRIGAAIEEALEDGFPEGKRSPLVCVGGTARAVLKLANQAYGLPDSNRSVDARGLSGLEELLCSGSREASDLILKLIPDRIHTIVPGFLILHHIFRLFGSEKIVVSQYGVREGYLCRMLEQ